MRPPPNPLAISRLDQVIPEIGVGRLIMPSARCQTDMPFYFKLTIFGHYILGNRAGIGDDGAMVRVGTIRECLLPFCQRNRKAGKL